MAGSMTQGGHEGRQIFWFTLPIIAGNLLQQLYQIVDGAIVGNYVGQDALSAVGTCGPLTILFLALAMGMSNGCSVMVSQFFGARKTDQLRRAVSTCLILLGGMGAAFSAAGAAGARFLLVQVVNVPAQVLGDALLYFRICCAGLFFSFLYNITAAILRAMGDSKATLCFLLISAVSNIVLDLLFVAVLSWDIAGAAAATVLAQALAAAASMVYMHRRHELLRFSPRTLRFYPEMGKLGLRLGVPTAVQQAVVSCGLIAIQRVINSFGSELMAAMTAGSKVYQFLLAPGQGFNVGVDTFTGQNMGAGRLDRVVRGYRKAQLMSAGIGLVLAIGAWLLAQPLAGLFGVEGAAREMGGAMIRTTALFLPLFSAYLCTSGLLRGSGDVMASMAIAIGALLLRTVSTYVMAYFTPIGQAAAWYSLPFDWVSAFLAGAVCYRLRPWRKKLLIHEKKVVE